MVERASSAVGAGSGTTTSAEQTMPAEPVRRGVIGYAAGVFDLFHEGHVCLLRRAREQCDHLIVGVSTDDVALDVHGSLPVFPFIERMEIIQSVRYVDHVVPQTSHDKAEAWHYLRFDRLFVGDNLHGSPLWEQITRDMERVGVDVVYLPATLDEDGSLLRRTAGDLKLAGHV
jgi:glycerol-3-phosphate cytidylyltransferase